MNYRTFFNTVFRIFLIITFSVSFFAVPCQYVSAATQIDIVSPPGGEEFGNTIILLPNGNLVVVDIGYNDGSKLDVGAVYLYDGKSGEMISMLTGSTAYDRIGNGGITILTNGNYVVRSPDWNLFSTTDVGAVTWGSQTSGVDGVVSADNSLVGTTANDKIGSGGIHALSNSNYVVLSPDFDYNGIQNTGAVTWGNGTTGIAGTIWSTNSLVGGAINDMVGISELIELTNGNYVLSNAYWDNGAASNAGAVTWGDGNKGVTGVVSAANSLVGSTANDSISGVVALENGNYVVYSQYWDNGGLTDAGMATLADGIAGKTGVITPANSLVGSTPSDRVGGDILKLSNSNFVVRSRFWDSNTVMDAGAVTWADGNSGIIGEISETNSLIGSTFDDMFAGYFYALSNGNYVVMNPYWDNGSVVNAGAVTWGNGSAGTVGVISSMNSLVGSSENDNVGVITELSNSNFTIYSPNWDNGAAINAGSITWGNGVSGISGIVSSDNSLVGTTSDDMFSLQIYPLSNGNYIVSNPYWDNGDEPDAGAVTWSDGTIGISGGISQLNSLVGKIANDFVGQLGVVSLTNDNYVVLSPEWDHDAVENAGAVTWGSGTVGISGLVSSTNSLVGSKADDLIGNNFVTPLSNGNYVVGSSRWDNDSIVNAGAVTWGDGTVGVSGIVSPMNSLVGSTLDDFFVWVGYSNTIPLSNGNYIVSNPNWDNGSIVNAGSVTWGNGSSGISGFVSSDNSLVGSTTEDRIGNYGIYPLQNGNYVVSSPNWDNGTVVNAGAVTWGNGTTGISDVVSMANSLVGSTADDLIGNYGVTAFSNGSYGFLSPYWDNGVVTNAGAITWGEGNKGAIGPITTENSVLGTAVNGGHYLNYTFDAVDKKLVVGRRADQIVTLFFFDDSEYIYLPLILK
ncbi:MAG: hypothetical protein Q7U53_13515 [Anaerolineaceae bacterium]|nr:hypothetical protein [Anaerolineaceae bacterium]